MSDGDASTTPNALAGLRILDLSGGIAGPLGVLVLAEHGADVIKVEPPGGGADRGGASSRVYDRSKRSVTLDLTTPEGRDVFFDLCESSDVVVEASGPGVMASLGLGYHDLEERFPRLVYCSIPSWPSGTRYEHRPGHEVLVQARTGQQWEITSFRDGPTFLASPVTSLGAAFLVPLGIMAALHARERTGRGQHVEVSLVQGALMLTSQVWNWTDRGSFSLPKTVPPTVHQSTIYECADGEWIHAATMSGITPTRSEASILGIRELSPVEMMGLSADERAALENAKKEAYKARRREDLVDEYHAPARGPRRRVPRRGPRRRGDRRAARAVRAPATARHGLGRRRGRPGDRDDDAVRRSDLPHRDARRGARSAATTGSTHRRRARRRGTHRGRDRFAARAGDRLMPGPLEGLQIVDFGQYLAGPFGPMLLAELGADVIKVEPLHGDGLRGLVGTFAGCQRSKRDIALDLKHPSGREIALQLVARADMVHHNMTLGTADRLGVGYDDCKSVNPDVLYCNNFMYGPVGPLAHLGGLDPLGQAASGIEWEGGGTAHGSPPLWHRYGHGDVAAAAPSAVALLIALWHRDQHDGGGQFLWSSILHGSMLYTADSWLGPDGTPSPRPSVDADVLGFGPLCRLYETGDGWLQLAAVDDRHWEPLCHTLRRTDLVDDDRFATAGARDANADALAQELESAFVDDLAVNWRRLLDAAGVPSEISVNTWDGETVLFDQELFELGLVTEFEHPILGRVRQFGNLVSFSDTPTDHPRRVPRLGEDTREILAELGYDSTAIDALRRDGVVSWPDDRYSFPI